ncbi:alternative ribosome rescue aminoacyl-tRNA hydrolase ArfB [Marixanthomonas spongiae]|uniref:Aminoacyl-tRNA hydrolase n=1 Tax=Marixanthomonas spongiae TaxID=2174845 RepID=A0A2U0I2M6_9FLAO|nr:alternative ribosome rescue aminoacyl-tRNA hydrolase ArfB [Marixanthomonas spongiae]PVW15357.1 aminoacyl-tRNA hydrolase [Marixanthomonas spongiae]
MNTDKLIKELTFKTMRSSGPGGQHVNKTSSKVEVSFNIESSQALSDQEKQRLQQKLQNKLTSDGTLSLQCSESRSQHRNKAIVIERLIALLKHSLKPVKKRKKTKIPKKAIEKRLNEKKKKALKKANRKPPKID